MRILPSVWLLGSLGLSVSLCSGCGSGDDSPAAAGSSTGGSSGGSSAGKGNGGSSAGKAGGGGSGAGKGGSGNAGSSQGGDSAAGDGGDQGGAETGGTAGDTGGAISHGGAPDVDYGSPQVPPATWTNITGTFAGMQSECGNMSGIFSSPLVDLLVLGVARQGLWSSTDGGDTFGKLGTSGDTILNRLTLVAWSPSSADDFYVSGIYGWESPFTDGVFRTKDRGASFSGFKTLSAIQSHNDSVSVDFTDPQHKVMLAGGHEQSEVLFRSTDAGATWTNIRDSLPDGLGFCTWTLVLDAKRMLVACAAGYSQKAGAIVRSSDGGQTWTKVSDKGAIAPPLWAYDGSIYWAAEAGGVLKSDDLGLTFSSALDNASNRVGPIQLPDGRVVTVANKALTATADGGKSWQPIGTTMPFDPTGLAYSPFRRAFFITQFDCNNNVPADAIERFGFDFKP